MNLPENAFPVLGLNPNQGFPSLQLHPSRNKLQLRIRIGEESRKAGGGLIVFYQWGCVPVCRAAYISGKHNPDSVLAGADSIKIQRQLC